MIKHLTPREGVYQITYNDALRICEAYKNFNFYKTEWIIDGFKVVTFNYFLCEYDWFVKPLENERFIHARDMRGVTFIFNEDGTLFRRYLMLRKFFNINQTPETLYDVVKDKKIKNITLKEDGSLIAFMKLPNEKIFAKTQGGIDNEQSLAANKIYEEREDIANLINSALEVDFTPLFEYVAYDNRIVLKYSGRELRLIGFRDNKYGEYVSVVDVNIESIKYKNVPRIKKLKEYRSVDDLLEMAKTMEDIEGWVVEFEDGQMLKIKCEWYIHKHGIRTVSIFIEDFIIQNYLNETLDDVITELNYEDDRDAFDFITNVKVSIVNWSNYIEDCVNELVNAYNDEKGFYFGNWAKFATDKHKSAYFGLAKTKIENSDKYKEKKVEYMLNTSKHLMEAKKLVKKWK